MSSEARLKETNKHPVFLSVTSSSRPVVHKSNREFAAASSFSSQRAPCSLYSRRDFPYSICQAMKPVTTYSLCKYGTFNPQAHDLSQALQIALDRTQSTDFLTPNWANYTVSTWDKLALHSPCGPFPLLGGSSMNSHPTVLICHLQLSL